MKPAQLNKLYDLCLADTDKRLAVMRQAASDGDDQLTRERRTLSKEAVEWWGLSTCKHLQLQWKSMV